MAQISKRLKKYKSSHLKIKSAPIALRVLLTHDSESGGYTAEVPDLQGCITGGSTREEALRMTHDAIECYLHAADDLNQEPLQKGVTEEWVYLNWVTAADKPLKLTYLKPAPKLKASVPRKQRKQPPKK